MKMLNKEAASSKNRPRDIIGQLGICEGYAADLGSAGGYFALELAWKVGTPGKVYAVDTKPRRTSMSGVSREDRA